MRRPPQGGLLVYGVSMITAAVFGSEHQSASNGLDCLGRFGTVRSTPIITFEALITAVTSPPVLRLSSSADFIRDGGCEDIPNADIYCDVGSSDTVLHILDGTFDLIAGAQAHIGLLASDSRSPEHEISAGGLYFQSRNLISVPCLTSASSPNRPSSPTDRTGSTK